MTVHAHDVSNCPLSILGPTPVIKGNAPVMPVGHKGLGIERPMIHDHIFGPSICITTRRLLTRDPRVTP